MNSNHTIVLDVWAHFATFRKGYTSTTSSTYPFIPRSAVEGLIGAIVGYGREEYPLLLFDSRIAVELRKTEFSSKIAKTTMGVLLTHSDFWRDQVGKYLENGRTIQHMRGPRSMELLVEPRYRIYFNTANDTVREALARNLRAHETFFTPYLGTNSMMANFEFVGEYDTVDVVPDAGARVSVVSVIPYFSEVPKVFVGPKATVSFEQNIPLHLGSDRVATGYYSAVYSQNLEQPILVEAVPYSQVTTEKGVVNVVFIPSSPS